MADIRLGNLFWKDNTQPNSVNNPVNTKDVNSDAIKNKVDTLATETKLEQVRTLLAGVATEDKLEQARALLQTISGKDFATQTTLAQVKSELELVKAELQAIKANQLSGDQKVQLSGTVDAVIKELEGNNGTPSGWRAYGENHPSSNLITPLDVSSYTDVIIRVQNDTSIGLEYCRVRLYTTTSTVPIHENTGAFKVFLVDTIPAGAVAYYKPSQYPELGEFCIGLVFAFYSQPPDGTVKVSFFGRRK